MIEISYLNNKQAQITTDVSTLDMIRNKFSVTNPAYGKGRNKFASARLYAITPTGKFDVGLAENICAYLQSEQFFFKLDQKLNDILNVGYKNFNIHQFYCLNYRDHQEKSIKEAMKKGRGVIIIPTAGGKTLIMAGVIESMQNNISVDSKRLKTLVIVPSIQLVEQTTSDFIKYGIESVTKWSGDNNPDPEADVIVAGTQILLSEKTDLSLLSDIDLLLIDEVHGLRRGNEINKIFNLITTNNRFGFTGTMPPSLIDQWNIIGKVGPVLYEEKTLDLKDKKYVSDFKIMILNIKHQNAPKFEINQLKPTEQYNKELEYLLSNERRNTIISNLAKRLDSNTVIMVDRIEHGVNIKNKIDELFEKDNSDRPIYFIQGSTEMEDRENIRSLMNDRNDVIVIAVSKIFSTGINIPNLHNIIFATAGKAKIKIMQSIGRALRLHPTKKSAIIFDIADNTKYSKKHLEERIKLYKNENYTYEEKQIQ
ncbi:MAG: DEAD/DEAH box helicase [Proteobacteria bacterium]|nr:DEAD/DEAH box helicase [Pseudomonadota bacterium]